ncbi:unnamed protein product [Phytomonas sp. EM1]|nr:unnamed protein product [Phytomonas sp. EM1]|eukprot:CCW61343.1 unnamed protein product [Phytomonas sp. isolate EM1]
MAVMKEINTRENNESSRTLSTEVDKINDHGITSASLPSLDVERTTDVWGDSAHIALLSTSHEAMATVSTPPIVQLSEGPETSKSSMHFSFVIVKSSLVSEWGKGDHLETLRCFSEETVTSCIAHAAVHFIQTEALQRDLDRPEIVEIDELELRQAEEIHVERQTDKSAAEAVYCFKEAHGAVKLFSQLEGAGQHGIMKYEDEERRMLLYEKREETPSASDEVTTKRCVEQTRIEENLTVEVRNETEIWQTGMPKYGLMMQAMIEPLVHELLNDCILEATAKLNCYERLDTESESRGSGSKFDARKEPEEQSTRADTVTTDHKVVNSNSQLVSLASDPRLFPNEEDGDAWSVAPSSSHVDDGAMGHTKGTLREDRTTDEEHGEALSGDTELSYCENRSDIMKNYITSAPDLALDTHLVIGTHAERKALDSLEFSGMPSATSIVLHACDNIFASFLQDGATQAMSTELSNMSQLERINEVDKSIQSTVYSVKEGGSIDSTPISLSMQTILRIEDNDNTPLQRPGEARGEVSLPMKGQVAGVTVTPIALRFFSDHLLDEYLALAFHNFISVGEAKSSVEPHDLITRRIFPSSLSPATAGVPAVASKSDFYCRLDDSAAVRAVVTYLVGDALQFVKDLEASYSLYSTCEFNRDADTVNCSKTTTETPASTILEHLRCDQVQRIMKKGITLALQDVIHASGSSALGGLRLLESAKGNGDGPSDQGEINVREGAELYLISHPLPPDWDAAADVVTERLARDLIRSAGMMVLKGRAYNMLYSDRFTTEYTTDLDCFRAVRLHEVFSPSHLSTRDVELLFFFYVEQARALGVGGSNPTQLGEVQDASGATLDSKFEAEEEDATVNKANRDSSPPISALAAHGSLGAPILIPGSGVNDGVAATAVEAALAQTDAKHGLDARGQLPPSALPSERINLFTRFNYESGSSREDTSNRLRGPRVNVHENTSNRSESGGREDYQAYINVSFMDAQRSGVSQLVLGHCLENIMDDMVMDTVTWIFKLIS